MTCCTKWTFLYPFKPKVHYAILFASTC